MYYRIKDTMDVDFLAKHLQKAGGEKRLIERIREIIEILTNAYGDLRRSHDMGGYILLFMSSEEFEEASEMLYRFYRISPETREYIEIIGENGAWYEETYLLTSEDSLVIIHRREPEME